MLTLECDYAEGAHEKVLEALMKTNREQVSGYGSDGYTESAKAKIRAACEAPEADVFFLTGGTQTNQVVIDSLLKSYEGVIAAVTGHVNGHEAGAIEFTGHKVLTLPERLGKIDAADLRQLGQDFFGDDNHEHMVFPGMVYISHPTEYGTLYTKAELAALREVCDEFRWPLYMDGARLGYGLMSRDTDVTLKDIAALTDVFYIGGTKVGALCGEAVVFPKGNAPAHYLTVVKQHGALLAKGRLTGIQFDALFTDGLYFQIAENAIRQAERMKDLFTRYGYRFFLPSPTNQQFFIMENGALERFGQRVGYSFWTKYDDTHTVIRLATSWATEDRQMDELESILKELAQNTN